MAKINPQDLKDRLLAPGFTAPPVLEQLSDPISDTPMVLTLDQVLPWHDNPRTTRNPKYDELKESIRHRGLDTPPPVTRRPGEDKYRIRNGGNTRLEILNELYKETGDERYFRFNCLFRPWDKQRGEIIALTGHLAENDLKGDLKFIERAVGIQKAKALYEKEKGEPVGIRELSRKLTDDGYPVSHSHISRMLDAVEILLPAIPVMLYSGLGKPQIEKLLSLRKSASSCWARLYAGEGIDFEMLFQDTLAIFDSSPDEFIFDRFQDELIDQMKRPLGLRYDQILLEITNGQQEQRRGTLVDLPAPALPPEIPPVGQESPAASTTGQAQSQSPAAGLQTSKTNSLPGNPSTPPTPPLPVQQQQLTDEERAALLAGHIVSPVSTKIQQTRQRLAALEGEHLPVFEETALHAIPVQVGGLHPITDLWYIERSIDTSEILRQHIADLAEEIALHVGAPGEIVRIQGGVGYTYREPNEDPEITDSALHLMTLLQALSGQVQVVLNSHDQQTCRDALGEFQFSAGLAQLLLGQPTTGDQPSSQAGRLNDEALVKLFRIIRLARRLVDLELPPAASEQAATDQ
ncbi:ParB family protein of integrating conjugative element (PFGI_1 class) [Pseudomonas aeruginosa]|mgnify:FL=1|nr:ParB [Pseudomonas aeruginosa]ERU68858.1 integrating conjugative element, PFGI_1 class, ParB family protein [Pseudomonas aeruginosa C40]ERU76164.1 integrating conjugative element, PFGI_1 class, ParB family protein [Pseudomonas aeruginosa C23]ERU76642.1 integrating conjugative element, PFGI_1 class, ParB family protein [Pseudomonas aeruginosa C20]ERW16911.1 integrating conjugative element, PFGI_1 class, ParB family protein [Pseudomonas aeruginosa BWHPSA023]ERW20069.1 integrating conjugative e